MHAVCENAATSSDYARLETLVMSDDVICHEYIGFMATHGSLMLLGDAPISAPADFPTGIDLNENPAANLPKPSSPTQHIAWSVPHVFKQVGRPVVWSTLAAGVVFAAYIVAISWNLLSKDPLRDHDVAAIGNQKSELAPVATIRNTADVQWSDQVGKSLRDLPSASRRDVSTEVTTGEPLAIDSGLVELQLKQGVTLVIEGPAQWSIDGNNTATLKRGKLVAKVPKQAIGFTLETPTAKIVDLGTEFGVEVDPVRGASVRVLKGQVDVRPTLVGDSVASSVRLDANQAVRVSFDSVAESIEPDSLKFTEAVSPATRLDASEAGYEVVLYYRMGEDDPAGPSDDDNAEVLQTFPHASASLQRPLKLMPSAFHVDGVTENVSRRAIRFDRRGATPQWEMLGVPSGINNWLLEAWVRVDEISNVQLAHVGDAHSGYGLVLWDGKFQGVFEDVSWISPATQPPLGKWTHLALLHEYGFTQLFVNGRPEGDTLKIDPPSHGGQFAIGVGESFQGAIDEVRFVKLKRAFKADMLLWKPANPVPKSPN
jgi:hypothetical protein